MPQESAEREIRVKIKSKKDSALNSYLNSLVAAGRRSPEYQPNAVEQIGSEADIGNC